MEFIKETANDFVSVCQSIISENEEPVLTSDQRKLIQEFLTNCRNQIQQSREILATIAPTNTLKFTMIEVEDKIFDSEKSVSKISRILSSPKEPLEVGCSALNYTLSVAAGVVTATAFHSPAAGVCALPIWGLLKVLKDQWKNKGNKEIQELYLHLKRLIEDMENSVKMIGEMYGFDISGVQKQFGGKQLSD